MPFRFEAPYLSFEIGAEPLAIRAGDLNGDGRPDLVLSTMSNWSSSTWLEILLGSGDGDFVPADVLELTSGEAFAFETAELADLDANSALDIVVASCPDSFTFFAGNGDGTFTHRKSTQCRNIGRFALGDVNGDTLPDLVVSLSAVDSIAVMLSAGDFAFEPRILYAMNERPTTVALRDLDGDGHVDVVVACTGASQVSVLRGRGDGSFLPKVDAYGGAYPLEFVIADLNADGRLDVAVADEHDTAISVLLGRSDGTLAPRERDFHTWGPVIDLAGGDFDGDGGLDLAMVTDFEAYSVLMGRGDGTFGSPAAFPCGSGPNCLALADFNGDGRIDAAAGDWNLKSASVLLGNGDGTFGRGQMLGTRVSPQSVLITDLNGDQVSDLLAATRFLTAFLGEGSGRFGAPIESETYYGTRVAAGDLNGDGHPDAVMSGYGVASLMLGRGDGGFGAPAFLDAGPAYDAAITDLDRDGHLDVVIARQEMLHTSGVTVLLGRGDGSFEPRRDTPAGGEGARALVLDDVNEDGHIDAVLLHDSSMSVFLGVGDGNFAESVMYPLGMVSLKAVALGDLNGDGRPEAVVAGPDSIVMLLNQGDGHFAPPSLLARSAGVVSVTMADLDRDGHLDVMGAQTHLNAVSIWRSRGDGTFESRSDLGTGARPLCVRAGDLDGDQLADLVVTNVDDYSPSVLVMLNRSRIVPIEIEAFTARTEDAGIRLAWRLSLETVQNLAAIRLQRAGAPAGPFEDRGAALEPRRAMEFLDVELEAGCDYWYRLLLLNEDGSQHVSPNGIGPVRARQAALTTLYQPMDEAGVPIRIRYDLARPNGLVQLAIYDARGQLVWHIERRGLQPGRYFESWNRRGRDRARVVRGIYFVQLTAGGVSSNRKLALLHP